jgi:hypothetical protein
MSIVVDGSVANGFLSGLKQDSPVVVLSALYLVLGIVLLDLSSAEWARFFLSSLAGLICITLICAILIRGIHHILLRADRPVTEIIREIRGIRLATISYYVPIAVSQLILASVFWGWKTHLPAFSWDQTLSDLDRMLHFGRLPWEWLQPVLGYWPVTFLIGANYGIWFLVMWSVWIVFAAGRHPDRTRFLLTFAMLWIVVGSIMASAFASAGPCYYEYLGLTENPYAPLMAYLNAADQHAPISALRVQDMLWQGHAGTGSDLGISAMPSMHNAIALLIVLASASFHRIVRWALKAHLLLIFLGSIHLGWHYAVDAYIAFAMTLAIWYGLGLLLQRRQTAPVEVT